MIKEGQVFIGNSTNTEYVITSFNEHYVTHESPDGYARTHCMKEFLEWHTPKEVVTTESITNSINDDIIKLIESGYKFKSFHGNTLNGRAIFLELEDEQ